MIRSDQFSFSCYSKDDAVVLAGSSYHHTRSVVTQACTSADDIVSSAVETLTNDVRVTKVSHVIVSHVEETNNVSVTVSPRAPVYLAFNAVVDVGRELIAASEEHVAASEEHIAALIQYVIARTCQLIMRLEQDGDVVKHVGDVQKCIDEDVSSFNDPTITVPDPDAVESFIASLFAPRCLRNENTLIAATNAAAKAVDTATAAAEAAAVAANKYQKTAPFVDWKKYAWHHHRVDALLDVYIFPCFRNIEYIQPITDIIQLCYTDVDHRSMFVDVGLAEIRTASLSLMCHSDKSPAIFYYLDKAIDMLSNIFSDPNYPYLLYMFESNNLQLGVDPTTEELDLQQGGNPLTIEQEEEYEMGVKKERTLLITMLATARAKNEATRHFGACDVKEKNKRPTTPTQNAHGMFRVELYPTTYRFALMLLMFSSAIFHRHLSPNKQDGTLQDVTYLVNNGLRHTKTGARPKIIHL